MSCFTSSGDGKLDGALNSPYSSIWQPVLGKQIGEGSFRTVYVKRGTKNRVIKVARNVQDRFHNYMEWMLWNRARPKLRRYLAPVYRMSPDGQYLEMARTIPDHCPPGRAPTMIRDAGSRNWGQLVSKAKRKRVVAHDYALFALKELSYPIWYDSYNRNNVEVYNDGTCSSY